MAIFRKLINKNYWISTLVIVLAIMLLENFVSNFILKYVSFPTLLISFLSILFLVLISRVLSEEILEIN